MFKQEMDQALEFSKCLSAAENDDGETHLSVRAARRKKSMAIKMMANSDPADRSTMLELPAESDGGRNYGERHYLWRTPTLKGCVHLFMPVGEVKVQGNTRQKAFWMGLISEFTEPWTDPVMATMRANTTL